MGRDSTKLRIKNALKHITGNFNPGGRKKFGGGACGADVSLKTRRVLKAPPIVTGYPHD
jgi:hypothetical protein